MIILNGLSLKAQIEAQKKAKENSIAKILANNESAFISAQESSSPTVKAAVQKVIAQTQIPDSEVLRVINEKIATPWLGLPLTPAMGQQYLTKFKNYISQGMSPDQAFDNIDAEFEKATDAEDVAFYESRTGNIISGGNSSNDPSLPYQPSLHQSNVRTAGASGSNNNMLIYGGIALVGLWLLFGNKGKGLSGTPKNIKSRKPAKKAKRKGKGSPATKSKKSGRMQVIDL